MLKSQVLQHSHSKSLLSLFPLHKPFISGTGIISFPLVRSRPMTFHKKHNNVRICYDATNIKAVATSTEKQVNVKAIVTVKKSIEGFFSSFGLNRGLDDITDVLGQSLLLELVCAELDPETGLEKKAIKGYARRMSEDENEAKYECDFVIPEDFGEVGAVLVQNEHHREMFLQDIVLNGLPNAQDTLSLTCASWVTSKFNNPEMRIFFTNKSYLPSETPSGLRKLREKELVNLRGNGEGERKSYDRIYDYAVYNDLGEPDTSADLARPLLGDMDYPYPRRCRTGRPPSKTDPSAEQRSATNYVPRDEAFMDVKEVTFSLKTIFSALHALLPALETAIVDSNLGFPYFTDIDKLYNEGINLPKLSKKNAGFWKSILPRLLKDATDVTQDILKFETPAMVERDQFAWFRDEEFARQTLAGTNPYSIQLVTEWPLKSKLDPQIYGPPESAITTELVEKEIKGVMSIDEALKGKKLFILDYHDLLLPFVKKVREIEGTTLYGSRTLFFLTQNGTLQVLAIELTRPPADGKPQWKQVFKPSWDATASWLWKLAKAHVLAHDSGYHELVSHWLRTHCCVEPYIIATNRQLSAMHPIYRLLHPHFRYTMEINALAREALINANGIIESSFSPGKYSMELSSVAYDQQWRFDKQGLPADLIHRGMAVEDPSATHGLKLTIEDYPFANDGLILWDILKQWVTNYVNHYYPNASLVQSDEELQEWWTEIRTKGHGDKKDEPWWPVLKTPQDLIEIITTIAWVASAHHAAVNFGQYDYGGYFPNRPTIARTNLPTEDPTEKEWENFLNKPEAALLQCFPSQLQAVKVMAVLDVLANHSVDEEYLGQQMEPSWAEDPIIKAAFKGFNGKLKELEGIIDARNANCHFKNRNGAGVVPYQLLKPFSKPGVTGMGVPFSVSI